MIFFLEGYVDSKNLESVIIDVHGVGYQVYVTPDTHAQCTVGEKKKLYTAFVVSETAQVLYGFVTPQDKDLFQRVQTAKGVGPKLALNILGTLGAAGLVDSVKNRDAQTISSVKGISLKGAERLILDLKDKIVDFETRALAISPQNGSGTQMTVGSHVSSLLIDALTGLGSHKAEAEDAVQHILERYPELKEEQDTSALLKLCLQYMNGEQ